MAKTPLPDAASGTVTPDAIVPASKPSKLRKILLLVDCAAGKCAHVVEVLAHEAEALIAGGHADDHPSAIAAHED